MKILAFVYKGDSLFISEYRWLFKYRSQTHQTHTDVLHLKITRITATGNVLLESLFNKVSGSKAYYETFQQKIDSHKLQ